MMAMKMDRPTIVMTDPWMRKGMRRPVRSLQAPITGAARLAEGAGSHDQPQPHRLRKSGTMCGYLGGGRDTLGCARCDGGGAEGWKEG